MKRAISRFFRKNHNKRVSVINRCIFDTFEERRMLSGVAPVLVDDAYSTPKNNALVVAAGTGVFANDTDNENDALTGAIVAQPASGTLAFTANTGGFTYTPANNFHGTVSFKYIVFDGNNVSTFATVTIQVNTPTVATNDAAYTTNEDNSLTDNVVTNDTDADGDSPYVSVVTQPTHGVLVCGTDGAFTYTPTGNWSGTDTFQYKVNDGYADSNTATATIVVSPVNDVPVGTNDSSTTLEDNAVTINVRTNDTDVETATGDLTVTKLTNPTKGAVVNNNDGTFTYTPNLNANGADSFTYKLNDGSADSAAVTVSITITPVNDAPVAIDQAHTINEDTTLNDNVTTGSSDVEGTALTAEKVTDPSHGVLTLNPDGTFSYTPTLNFNGSDSFTYKLSDGAAYSEIKTVSITIDAVNDVPVGNADSGTTNEDTAVTINVRANDTDVETATGSLTVGNLTNGAHGTTVNNGDGTITYTPAANWFGTDTFTYTVTDANAATTAPVTVTVTVNPVNDVPVANNDAGNSTDEDTATTISVKANDSDSDTTNPSPDILTPVIVAQPTHGVAVVNGNGTITYTPTANYNGLDSFTYKINDGTTDSNTATVSITVNSINDVPVGNADSGTTNEDNAVTINVRANDTDVETATGSLTVGDLTNGAHGTTVNNGDGTITYTPAANWFGTDTFTYTVTDANPATTAPVTVTVTVNSVNDVPIAIDHAHTINEDEPLSDDVTTGSSDVEGSALTGSVVVGPTHGQVSMNANGTYTYTPTLNYNGSDSFTYKLSDGTDYSLVKTVSITIDPVNDAPVATADSYSTNEDTVLTKTAVTGVLSNDTDVEESPLTATVVDNVLHGSLTLNANGSFTYTPTANYNGTDSFTYKANDGVNNSATVTVTITVNSVNDLPTAVADTVTTDEDTPVAISVKANDSDNDTANAENPDTLTPIIVAQPSHGVAVVNGNGTITYTPTGNYHGADSFTYKLNDGHVDSDAVAVSITVTSVNDVPVGTNDSSTTLEDNAVTINVRTNDTDVETATGDLTVIKLTNPTKGAVVNNNDGTFTYTPNLNANGADSFTYKLNDGTNDSAAVTVSITITPVNDAPVAIDHAHTINEDATLNDDVTTGSSDVEGTVLTAEKVTDPSHGVLTLNSDGTFSYTPTLNFNGSDSFTYKLSDGAANSEIKTVSITIDAVNDVPTASNQSYMTGVDETLTIDAAHGLLAGASDVEGSNLTATIVAQPQHGVLTPNPDGSFTFVPTALYHGTDSFTFKANDGTGDSVVKTVTILVNSAVQATADEYEVNEDGSLSVGVGSGVLANDVNFEGDPITLSSVDLPEHGDLTLNPDGSFTYDPDDNYNGTDTFTYKVNDGYVDSATVTVTIDVISINDIPTAIDRDLATDEDVAIVKDAANGLLNGSADVETVNLIVDIVDQPQHGVLEVGEDGSFSYTPDENYSGDDSFTYKLFDGDDYSDTKTVSLTINSVNDAPVAVADEYTLDEDGELNVDAEGGILANDSDVEGSVLTIVPGAQPSHGDLTLNADGSFIYTPDVNFNGVDTFTYKINDGTDDSEVVTVTINVTAVNDVPVAQDVELATDEDIVLTVDAESGLMTVVSDVDGDALTATIVAEPEHGVLSVNEDGSFSYTPQANYNGADSFTYKVSDGEEYSEIKTVSITINSVNDAPVSLEDAYEVDEDGELTVGAEDGVLSNDSDVEDDALTVSLVDDAQHGVLDLHDDGSFTYTPQANYNGEDTFTYKVNDGMDDGEVVTVTLTINAIADAPVAADDEYGMLEDETLEVGVDEGVLANDQDIDGNGLTAELVDDVQHGELSLGEDGSFSYTPNPNFYGEDTFTYKTFDGVSYSETVTVTITVENVEDPLETMEDAYTTDEDAPLEVGVDEGVLANDTGGDDALVATVDTAPEHGELTLNEDGSFTYTPEANYNGEDFFTYTVNGSDPVTVTLTINSVNDAPIGVNQTLERNPGSEISMTLEGVFTDGDEDALGYYISTNPLRGKAYINNAGTPFDTSDDYIEYVPKKGNFQGDSFKITATDGQEEDEILVTVNAKNVGLTPNAVNPAKMDLYVIGTSGNDNILVQQSGSNVKVYVNKVNKGTFSVTGKIIVHGMAGNDVISANGVYKQCQLFGDAGNDKITGSNKACLLSGGTGRDTIISNNSKDAILGAELAEILD